VQLAGGSTVLGAEWLTARRGEGIVLDLADEPPIESASGLIERLARRPADARESEVLAAIAAVASPDLPLVYVGFDKGVACVFIVSDGGLERIDGRARARRAPATRPRREVEDRPVAAPAPGERPAAGAFRAAVGVGFGGGWRSGRFDGTTDSDGELLAGLYARVGLGPLWSIAAEVAPTALTSTLNPSASGVEGGVPLLVGVRNGERSRGFSPEFGGDIGVRFSGGSADPSLGLVARACAGGAGASGKRSGVRVGGCAAYSDGSLSLGIFLGVESRLDE
jgi:hypothetical protein